MVIYVHYIPILSVPKRQIINLNLVAREQLERIENAMPHTHARTKRAWIGCVFDSIYLLNHALIIEMHHQVCSFWWIVHLARNMLTIVMNRCNYIVLQSLLKVLLLNSIQNENKLQPISNLLCSSTPSLLRVHEWAFEWCFSQNVTLLHGKSVDGSARNATLERTKQKASVCSNHNENHNHYYEL